MTEQTPEAERPIDLNAGYGPLKLVERRRENDGRGSVWLMMLESVVTGVSTLR